MADRRVLVVGVGSVVLVASMHPALLTPTLLAVVVWGGLLLLLIATLALLAVCSTDPDRRAAAKEILDRLLNVLRPGT